LFSKDHQQFFRNFNPLVQQVTPLSTLINKHNHYILFFFFNKNKRNVLLKTKFQKRQDDIENYFGNQYYGNEQQDAFCTF